MCPKQFIIYSFTYLHLKKCDNKINHVLSILTTRGTFSKYKRLTSPHLRGQPGYTKNLDTPAILHLDNRLYVTTHHS